MSNQISYPHRLSDIVAGAVTHGVGVGLAIAATVLLIVRASGKGGLLVTSVSIYGACLIVAYLSSTLYHSLVRTKLYKVFRTLDHSLIFFLIGGTYTPIVLTVFNPGLGWTIFGIIWGLAILGIISKSFSFRLHPGFSVAMYVFMGWFIVFFISPLWNTLPHAATWLLLTGGAAYTIGIVFFAFEDIPYFHSIWHLFVLGGSILHFLMIYMYIA